MKKYEKDCIIVLKGGILKSYYFSDEFIKNNNELFNKFCDVWDELYEHDCCVFGASERNKNNNNIKTKLCNILDKMFDLNIKIMDGFDNKIYKNKQDYKNYILNYGKEV